MSLSRPSTQFKYLYKEKNREESLFIKHKCLQHLFFIHLLAKIPFHKEKSFLLFFLWLLRSSRLNIDPAKEPHKQ